MIDPVEDIRRRLQYFGPELVDKIIAASNIVEVPKQTELLREGQYVKVVPIVQKGLLKVFTRQQDKELLLYYIEPFESCVMSFAASLKNEQSKVFAIAEEDSTLLLLPADKIPQWINQYPKLNQLFYQQYDLRYAELLNTINHLLFDKLDKRLFDFLTERVKRTGKNPIKISHREIAQELGTAREVVSRLIKKLEKEHKLKQHYDSVEVLG
jgi:CRP/FNR family transcriptional regulator